MYVSFGCTGDSICQDVCIYDDDAMELQMLYDYDMMSNSFSMLL